MIRKLTVSALLITALLPGTLRAQSAYSQSAYSQSARTQGGQPQGVFAMYVGGGSGVNFSGLRISRLDSKQYPAHTSLTSPVTSLFLEFDFGRQYQVAVRPQVSWTSRGGSLTRIGENTFPEYKLPDTDPHQLTDVGYRLKANYFDIRIPVMYQFGTREWTLRPYAGIVPILGYATGGSVTGYYKYRSGMFNGTRYSATRGNLDEQYFAIAPAAGCKFNIPSGKNPIYIAVEASYQIGLNNTYGTVDRTGTGTMESFFPLAASKTSGTRRLSGFECSVSVGIPLSSLIHRRTPVLPEIGNPTEWAEQGRIYTLDELTSMAARGKKIPSGATLRADDQTIPFETGKSTLPTSAYPYLDQLAKALHHIKGDVLIKGHTDNVGSEDYNLELSRRRAIAVYDYLRNKGISPSRLTYQACGVWEPLGDNDTEAGRRLNRRVEFVIQ